MKLRRKLDGLYFLYHPVQHNKVQRSELTFSVYLPDIKSWNWSRFEESQEFATYQL